jgi:hypothetical protein
MSKLPPLPLVASEFPSLLESGPLRMSDLPVPEKKAPPPPPRPSLPLFNRLESEPPPLPKPRVIPTLPKNDFTDNDLLEALLPLLAAAPSNATLPDTAAFESILRNSFRRALAEHSTGPFQNPDLLHRSLWRVKALFSSRSYEDVIDEKLRRFRVEEVHLLDRRKLSMISFASSDPVRHSNARKVDAMARRLATAIKDDSGAVAFSGKVPDGRSFFVREGRYSYLVAIVRGEPDELVKADLEFSLKRIESRFRIPFERGAPLLQEIQPFLEDCLMIHSPAAPAAA